MLSFDGSKNALRFTWNQRLNWNTLPLRSFTLNWVDTWIWARFPAAVSGNEPALIPEKTAGLVNETLLISTNQKLACLDQAGRSGSINYFSQNKFQDGGCEGTVRSACDRVLDRLKMENLNIWRGIAYVWYPMTFPATSNMHKLNYVTATIGRSRVQPSLLGEARGTERAAEIEPNVDTAYRRTYAVETPSLVDTQYFSLLRRQTKRAKEIDVFVFLVHKARWSSEKQWCFLKRDQSPCWYVSLVLEARWSNHFTIRLTFTLRFSQLHCGTIDHGGSFLQYD